MDDAFLIVVIGVSLLGFVVAVIALATSGGSYDQHRPRRAVDRRGPAGPAGRPRPPVSAAERDAEIRQ